MNTIEKINDTILSFIEENSGDGPMGLPDLKFHVNSVKEREQSAFQRVSVYIEDNNEKNEIFSWKIRRETPFSSSDASDFFLEYSTIAVNETIKSGFNDKLFLGSRKLLKKIYEAQDAVSKPKRTTIFLNTEKVDEFDNLLAETIHYTYN